MTIKDRKLQELLDDNHLEFNYNEQVTGRILSEVCMYIHNGEQLVDITFNRDGLFQAAIFLDEDTQVDLSKNQLNLIYDMFDDFFKAQERQDINDHYEWKARQDDYLSYYIR